MNTGYREYAQLAYKRTIISALRHFLGEHVSSEMPASKELLCEEVLASDREVPEEAFLDVIEDMEKEEQILRVQMTQFEFVRKERKAEIQSETEVSNGTTP